MGEERLENYLAESSQGLDSEEVNLILEEGLQDSNLLLILDDIHNASEEIPQFFRSFKDILPETDVKFVAIGRAIPLFYDQRDVLVRERVKELTLGGLEEESSLALLEQRDVDSQYHDNLYSVTGGHPLMLELVSPESKTEAIDFIDEEVIDRLSDEGRKAMKMASVFRAPFSPDFLREQGISEDTLDNLLEKSLLRRVNEDYEVHEMLRDIFYTRLISEEKVKYHELTSQYCLDKEEPIEIIEAIYHLIKSYNHSEAAKIAISHREDILVKGHLKPLLRELDKIDEEEAPDYWPGVLFLKGEIYRKLGDLDEALNNYRDSLEHVESIASGVGGDISYLWFGLPEGIKEMRAESHFRVAQIYEKKGNVSRAEESYEASLEGYEDLGEEEEAEKVREVLDEIRG